MCRRIGAFVKEDTVLQITLFINFCCGRSVKGLPIGLYIINGPE